VLISQRLRCVLKTGLIAGLFICTTFAADTFYLGTWKIDSAVVAPWANPQLRQDPAEMKSLVGKTVVIKGNEITGPRAVACKGPKYQVKDYPADMLFQGAFDEMRRRDKSVNPVKVAEKLGFRGSKWKTLETGCANELELHFIDPNTTTFGLNNYVYVLKKQ
jgi:hypothetical protein